MSLLRIPKPPHGSAEWLRLRWVDDITGLKRISASAAAAVHDAHKFTSRAALAAMLLAPEPPQPVAPTEAMTRGNTLEPALITHLGDVIRPQGLRVEPADSHMFVAGRLIATLDCEVWEGTEFMGPGECKTTKDYWSGVLPLTWKWQGVQQAICTNSDIVWWCILDGDLRLHTHLQTVSEDDKQQHTSAVEDFLSWIDMGTFPPDASPTAADIAQAYPQASPGSSIEFTAADMEIVAQLRIAKENVKRWQAEEKDCQAHIASVLCDAETATFNGDTVLTWKTQNKAAYTVKESTSRVMRLTKEK